MMDHHATDCKLHASCNPLHCAPLIAKGWLRRNLMTRGLRGVGAAHKARSEVATEAENGPSSLAMQHK